MAEVELDLLTEPERRACLRDTGAAAGARTSADLARATLAEAEAELARAQTERESLARQVLDARLPLDPTLPADDERAADLVARASLAVRRVDELAARLTALRGELARAEAASADAQAAAARWAVVPLRRTTVATLLDLADLLGQASDRAGHAMEAEQAARQAWQRANRGGAGMVPKDEPKDLRKLHDELRQHARAIGQHAAARMRSIENSTLAGEAVARANERRQAEAAMEVG